MGRQRASILKSLEHGVGMRHFIKIILTFCFTLIVVLFLLTFDKSGSIGHTLQNWAALAYEKIALPGQILEESIQKAKHVVSIDGHTSPQDEELKAQMHAYQMQIKALESENKHLKNQLNFVDGMNPQFLSAPIYKVHNGYFPENYILRAGAEDGIKKHQLVLFRKQIIGRVIDVFQNTSRILLATDLNSRIPARIESSSLFCVVSGHSDGKLHAKYLKNAGDVQIGQWVFTSGHGGVCPSGYTLGKIISIVHDDVILENTVPIDEMDIVQVILSDESVETPSIKS